MQFPANLHRLLLLVLLLPGLRLGVAAQTSSTQSSRIVALRLPPGIRSESVQISSFMVGAFGGRGGGVRPTKGQTSFEIDTQVDGAAASQIKIVAYLPGCEFILLEIPLGNHSVARKLPCKPVRLLPFRGAIFPISTTQDQPAVVEVAYLAAWANSFFGVFDGFVPTFQIAKIKPDEDGQFECEVPDLYLQQQSLGSGTLQFILRNTQTGNIIAFLKPVENRDDSRELKIQSSYARVRFVAEVR